MRLLQRGLVLAVLAGIVVLGGCGQQEVERAALHRVTPTAGTTNTWPRPRSTPTTVSLRRVLGGVRAVFDQAGPWIATTTTQAVKPRPIAPVVVSAGTVNGYPCGGDLPPCYVLYRESHGIPMVVEGGGSPYSHASGLWQFIPSTWNGYAGYPYAAAAPAEVQNAKARELWAGGAGCSHWSAC